MSCPVCELNVCVSGKVRQDGSKERDSNTQREQERWRKKDLLWVRDTEEKRKKNTSLFASVLSQSDYCLPKYSDCHKASCWGFLQYQGALKLFPNYWLKINYIHVRTTINSVTQCTSHLFNKYYGSCCSLTSVKQLMMYGIWQIMVESVIIA